MKVLVIYDLVPEETKRAIVEMTEEEYKYFSQAHGFYVNSDEEEIKTEIVLVIDNALASNPEHIEYCDTDKQREYFGKWTSDLDNTDLTGVDKLIHCGFIL